MTVRTDLRMGGRYSDLQIAREFKIRVCAGSQIQGWRFHWKFPFSAGA